MYGRDFDFGADGASALRPLVLASAFLVPDAGTAAGVAAAAAAGVAAAAEGVAAAADSWIVEGDAVGLTSAAGGLWSSMRPPLLEGTSVGDSRRVGALEGVAGGGGSLLVGDPPAGTPFPNPSRSICSVKSSTSEAPEACREVGAAGGFDVPLGAEAAFAVDGAGAAVGCCCEVTDSAGAEDPTGGDGCSGVGLRLRGGCSWVWGGELRSGGFWAAWS